MYAIGIILIAGEITPMRLLSPFVHQCVGAHALRALGVADQNNLRLALVPHMRLVDGPFGTIEIAAYAHEIGRMTVHLGALENDQGPPGSCL